MLCLLSHKSETFIPLFYIFMLTNPKRKFLSSTELNSWVKTCIVEDKIQQMIDISMHVYISIYFCIDLKVLTPKSYVYLHIPKQTIYMWKLKALMLVGEL